MAKVHVKVNDNVFVLNGKDAGKTGKVLKVDPKNNRVVVEGVNIITKHQKPDMRLNTGGLVKKEAAINASKVMLVCPKCKKPSKTGYRFLDNGDKVRYCKSCNADLETVRKAK